MSKQTAVEWLFQQLTTVDYNCINKTFLQNDNSLEGHNMRKLFHQALKMESEQSQNYAIFAIKCDRTEMRILEFNDYVKLEENEEK
jgi:hypothetical protein